VSRGLSQRYTARTCGPLTKQTTGGGYRWTQCDQTGDRKQTAKDQGHEKNSGTEARAPSGHRPRLWPSLVPNPRGGRKTLAPKNSRAGKSVGNRKLPASQRGSGRLHTVNRRDPTRHGAQHYREGIGLVCYSTPRDLIPKTRPYWKSRFVRIAKLDRPRQSRSSNMR
jgi:hypothetical protein